MVLYGTQCTGTWYLKSTAYPYTEYREVYIRYLGLKFGDMDRRLRSIPVSDLCVIDINTDDHPNLRVG